MALLFGRRLRHPSLGVGGAFPSPRPIGASSLHADLLRPLPPPMEDERGKLPRQLERRHSSGFARPDQGSLLKRKRNQYLHSIFLLSNDSTCNVFSRDEGSASVGLLVRESVSWVRVNDTVSRQVGSNRFFLQKPLETYIDRLRI